MKYKLFFLIFIFVSSILNARIEDYIDTRYEIIENKTIIFYANNRNFCPYQYKIIFYGNYVDKLSQKEFTGIVNNNQGEIELFRVDSNDILPNKITWTEKFKAGDPSIKIDSNYIYRLPFADSESYRVTQAFNSRYSHKGWQCYSVDFAMNAGSPVYAARGGVVIDFKKDSNIGGRNQRYVKYTNYLVIYHNDGTFSGYLHLQKDGVIVNVGDIVNEGDIIGYSGNTGWSGGAHLHFMVYKSIKFDFQTIPITFFGEGFDKKEPKFNIYYTAISREKLDNYATVSNTKDGQQTIIEEEQIDKLSDKIVTNREDKSQTTQEEEQIGGLLDKTDEELISIEDTSIGSF